MLLAVLAGTIAVSLAVLAVVLAIDAMLAGAPPGDGADWGALY